MEELKLPSYSAIIRTIDAEIKGYEKLSPESKNNILPIFELTRSRPLKNYPKGDIHKRMAQVRDMVENRPLILDITHHEDLVNDQIEDLQDDTGTFREWRDFLDSYNDLNIIPIVHFYSDDLPTLSLHASLLLKKHKYIAIRITFENTIADLKSYLDQLNSSKEDIKNLILVLDLEYIDESNADVIKSKSIEYLDTIKSYPVYRTIICSSSFPKSVTDRNGGDESDSLDMLETDIFKRIKQDSEDANNLYYGDYGGAHPIKKSIPASNWIPRVDVVTDSSFNYFRCRRKQGGYIEAAKSMKSSNLYDAIDCWGKEQIELAAIGEPQGKSPAFWISVRINQHLTRLSKMFPFS